MKPKINDFCIACMTCEGICPEVFKVVDGKATVLDANYANYKDKIDEAIASCAVQAIEWEEEAVVEEVSTEQE
ncbi:MAG: ferredoxin [Candidatus Buchananbacteria bacterium]